MDDFDPAQVISAGEFDSSKVLPPDAQRGPLGEIGTAFARGALVGLPQMVGQALQYTSSPGNAVYNAGQKIRETAENYGAQPGLTLHPEAHGAIVNALASGAEMAPSILAPVAIGAGALAALPVELPALAGTALVSSAAAIPFALQAGQETKEKAEKAGVPEDAATTASRLNAGLTFATQVGLGFVGGQALGRGAQFFGGLVRKDGVDLATQTLAELTGRAGTVAPFLKNLPVAAGEAALVGGAQAGGSAAIEKAYGVDNQDPIQAALESVPAMLGLTAVLSPLGLAARALRASSLAKRAEALENKETSPTIRDQLARQYAVELAKTDPQAAATFADNAKLAIETGQPLVVDKGLFQQGAVQRPAPSEVSRLVDEAKAKADQMQLAPQEPLPGGGAATTPEVASLVDQAKAKAEQLQLESKAVADNRVAIQHTHDQIVDELKNAGVKPAESLSFGRFRELMGEEAKKAGLKPDDLSPGDYAQMYQQHQRDVMNENFGKAQELAFNTFKVGESGKPAPKSALAVALEDAMKRQQVDEAYRQREAQRDRERAAIQNVSRGQQLAAAAEEGKTPAGVKTVPARAERVVTELRAVKDAEQAMPPKLMKEVTAAVSGKRSLEAQLEAIRGLRDAKDPKTASYELLDKLHTRLGGDNATRVEGTGRVLRDTSPGSPAQMAKGGAGQHPILTPVRAEKQSGEGQGNAQGEVKRGRTAGTTDDRHTIGPPNEVGELLPYTRTLSQAREGAGGIFGEKQWWQDLAWAVRNPETKIGKELLENGKFTDEQLGQALARDERYQKSDALLEQMRQQREERLRKLALAEAQPEEAKEILKAKDLKNIFGGDESDYEFGKKGQPGDERGVRELFAGGVAHKVADILSGLQKLATRPEQKALIEALQQLNLDTTVTLVDRPLPDGHQGLYSDTFNHVLIGAGGARIDTVLHEIVHAATLPRLDQGLAILSNLNRGEVKFADLTPEQRRLAGAADELKELYLDAQSREGAKGFYGMQNLHEFVAEALSSKAFQNFLRGGEESLWKRFVNFIQRVLGRPVKSDILDRALTVSREFLGDNQKAVVTESNRPSIENFMASPVRAADQTDRVLAKMADLGDAALSLKQGFTRAHLYAGSLNHIRQVFTKILPEPFRPALANLTAAKDRTKAMVEERNRDALDISREMAALPKDLELKLYRLQGEATRFGIFPDRSIAEQAWKASEAPPEKIRKYNELRAIYQSSPELAKAYDKSAAFNKADYDRGHATIVRNIARYSDMPQALWKAIDVTKGRSPEVEALEKWVLANGSDEQRVMMRGALAQYREKQQGPYFHLGRNGSYFVRFTVADNPAARAAYEKELGISPLTADRVIAPEDRHVFARFESVGEWKAVADKLNKLDKAGHLEPEMQAGQLETMVNKLDSSSPSFVRGLLRNIESDTRLDDQQRQQALEVVRRLAVEMLPETSASKAFAQRKGVAGYDIDMNRNFVKRAAAMSYFVAHNSIRPEVEDAMLLLKQGVNALTTSGEYYHNDKGLIASALQDELKKRQANDLAAVKTPMLDNISALSHTFYLALNPAFFMMKTLQPWQLALPQLGARHGFVASFKAMTKGTATALGIIKDTIGEGWQRGEWRGIIDPNIVVDRARATQAEKTFLRALIDSGGVTFTQAHDMGRIAAGESQGVSTTVKVGNASLHYSEALDRMTAGLAGFNLELKRTGDIDKATQYGIQIVKNSLYDYNVHNKGRMFSKQGVFGGATPLLTQFAQYQVQTLELMGRLTMNAFGKIDPTMSATERTAAEGERAEARKALAGLMATTLVLSGTMGLPAVTVIAAAYNALFSTRDEPVDAQADYRNFLADTFGKDAGEIIAHGGLRALGTDLGGTHLGFENIIPFSRFLADRRKLQDRFDSGALAMMGPAIGAAGGFAYGIQNILQGRYMKGLEEMLPSGLKGPAKAIDLGTFGMTDLKGNKLPVDITSWDLLNQALNLTPAKVAEQREAQRGANTTKMLLEQRSSELKENFAVALERGQGDEVQRLTDKIIEFNKANPDFAIRDLVGILRQRAIARAGVEQVNVETGTHQFPRLEREARFANVRGMP